MPHSIIYQTGKVIYKLLTNNIEVLVMIMANDSKATDDQHIVWHFKCLMKGAPQKCFQSWKSIA